MRERRTRQSIRWRGYDYRAGGYYFVTICTINREPLFCAIDDGDMLLNELGRVVEAEWFHSVKIRQELKLDAFIIMPNHLHGIVALSRPEVGAHGMRPPDHDGTYRGEQQLPDTLTAPVLQRPGRSLGAFVGGFKSAATRRVNEIRALAGTPVWQRNYYEHVIRDDDALARVRYYIVTNPENWHRDAENPAAPTSTRPARSDDE